MSRQFGSFKEDKRASLAVEANLSTGVVCFEASREGLSMVAREPWQRRNIPGEAETERNRVGSLPADSPEAFSKQTSTTIVRGSRSRTANSQTMSCISTGKWAKWMNLMNVPRPSMSSS